LYSTTFTLPRGAGAAGFAATATATLPSGRGRDVTAGAADDAGFGEQDFAAVVEAVRQRSDAA
jgi:hypothetical protein